MGACALAQSRQSLRCLPRTAPPLHRDTKCIIRWMWVSTSAVYWYCKYCNNRTIKQNLLLFIIHKKIVLRGFFITRRLSVTLDSWRLLASLISSGPMGFICQCESLEYAAECMLCKSRLPATSLVYLSHLLSLSRAPGKRKIIFQVLHQGITL